MREPRARERYLLAGDLADFASAHDDTGVITGLTRAEPVAELGVELFLELLLYFVAVVEATLGHEAHEHETRCLVAVAGLAGGPPLTVATGSGVVEILAGRRHHAEGSGVRGRASVDTDDVELVAVVDELGALIAEAVIAAIERNVAVERVEDLDTLAVGSCLDGHLADGLLAEVDGDTVAPCGAGCCDGLATVYDVSASIRGVATTASGRDKSEHCHDRQGCTDTESTHWEVSL